MLREYAITQRLSRNLNLLKHNRQTDKIMCRLNVIGIFTKQGWQHQ
jgi:hypothetical protein